MHVLRTVVDVVLALATLLRGQGFTELALGLVLGRLILSPVCRERSWAPFLPLDHRPSQLIAARGSFDGQELGGQFRMVSSSPNGRSLALGSCAALLACAGVGRIVLLRHQRSPPCRTRRPR